ncbi:MAG: hypothetical protein AB7V16_07100 [Vulcanibacillus sp.]
MIAPCVKMNHKGQVKKSRKIDQSNLSLTWEGTCLIIPYKCRSKEETFHRLYCNSVEQARILSLCYVYKIPMSNPSRKRFRFLYDVNTNHYVFFNTIEELYVDKNFCDYIKSNFPEGTLDEFHKRLY